jgi:hypothetical protein
MFRFTTDRLFSILQTKKTEWNDKRNDFYMAKKLIGQNVLILREIYHSTLDHPLITQRSRITIFLPF